jgi:HD-GYP domain-containing protein (c-di-GMP phosphodiesterase class II)
MAGPEISARSVKAKNLRRASGQILQQLFLASRLHQLYSGEHENVRQAYDSLAARLSELFSFEEKFLLTVDDGYLFANDIRLRVERNAAEAYDWFLERLADSGIASIAIRRDVKPVELRKFVPIFAKATWPEGGLPPPVPHDLVEEFVLNVAVTMRAKREIGEDDGGRTEVSARQLAIALWFRLHGEATTIAAAAAHGGQLGLKRARYLIQLAVDTFLEDEAALLAMTRMKNYVPPEAAAAGGAKAQAAGRFQGYLESHLVNTCLLAIGLGNRIGLARRQLLDLGTAALTADIGMARVPREIREKAGPLTPAERRVVERHPLFSAEALLRTDETSGTNRLCATIAADHHPRGYPRLKEGGKPSLLAAIVAIADAYDAMTTDRPWRAALSHAEALRLLVSGDDGHDRLLAKAFANLLGVYPAGSVVELGSGELGVIVEQSRDPKLLARPKVKLLIDARGRNVEGRVVDLVERGPGGAFLRSIDRVLDLRDLASGAGDLVALL